jgi:hypothetical protein
MELTFNWKFEALKQHCCALVHSLYFNGLTINLQYNSEIRKAIILIDLDATRSVGYE